MFKLLSPYWWFHWRTETTSAYTLEYVKAKQALLPAVNGEAAIQSSDENIIKWTYEVLAVLDSKASALMRLNGVMLATTAVLLSLPGAGSDPRITALCACFSALSIVVCLVVVSVDWRFLGLVEFTNDSTNFRNETVHLQQVCGFRQSCYRFAWSVSLVAAVLFLVEIGIRTYTVIYCGVVQQS